MNKIKKVIPLIILSVFLLFIALPTSVQAQDNEDRLKILDCESANKDCDLNDFGRTLYSISKLILGITGSLALLMFVYGGFIWLISGGNKEAVQKGKNILIAATIGIIIVFVAYSAVEFTIKGLTDATEGKEKAKIFDEEWNK